MDGAYLAMMMPVDRHALVALPQLNSPNFPPEEVCDLLPGVEPARFVRAFAMEGWMIGLASWRHVRFLLAPRHWRWFARNMNVAEAGSEKSRTRLTWNVSVTSIGRLAVERQGEKSPRLDCHE
jgi:hypothetical protein